MTKETLLDANKSMVLERKISACRNLASKHHTESQKNNNNNNIL
jgi:hypothetical protein